nr:transmembrane protease serine 9-like [Vanessa tameamea]
MLNISAVLLLFACCGTIVHCRDIGDSKEENITISDVPNGEDKFDKNDGCNCRCGERNEASRIVGGVETAVNEFPWVARLTYFNKFYCGGMLINDRYVLTAAHCVKGLMWFMIKVTLGEHNRCNETHRPETRFVVNVVAHNFTYLTFRDDIAVLKLNEKVQISDTIKPVCLPRSDDNQYEGVKAIAVGWGSVGEQKNHSCNLLDVELPVLSNKECRNTKYESAMIADDMLCAGYPKEGKRDTCQGDSGGPLSAERGDKRYELLGVVSWGIGCGRQGYPGVYTRVTKYLDWIKNNSRNGCFWCGITKNYANHSKSGRSFSNDIYTGYRMPWLATIHTGTTTIRGTLISDKHVITAANPLFRKSASEIVVTLGSQTCKEGSHALNTSVEAILIHPSYSGSVRNNDIALLRLRNPIKFSSFISPICMPLYDIGKLDQLAWTASKIKNKSDLCLTRVVTLPILSSRTCKGNTLFNSSVTLSDKGCLGPLGTKSILCEINGSKSNHSCECGIAGKNRRIVGGTTVQPHQYPWLVALMLGSKLHCGGAIITDQHILTAGHCITFGVHYRDLSAHIGMHDRLGSSHSVMHFSKGVKHPSFTSNAVRDINDIAVLTLEKKLKFSDKVRPICLPSEDMTFGELPLTVAGWGKTRQGALTSSRYLLETRVKLVMSHVCTKSSIYKDNFVSDSMMCAYSLGKDACQGDSGGPIFATHSRTHHKKWYQVGIVSWGIDCAKPDYPGVYTIVAKYIPWIKQQTVARLLLGTDSIHSRTPRSVVITRKVKNSNVASYNTNHLLYGDIKSKRNMSPSDEIISVRIVGGRRAEPHSFPWTVAIMKIDKLHCGGAVITDRHILTAGHCFKWDDVKLLTVLMGLDNLEHLEDVEKRSILKTVIHKDFTTTAVRDENDIAIATINKPVKFSKIIIPICLPDSGQDFSDRVGTVVGWGRLGVDKSSSKVLMKASLRILNDEDCMNSKLSTHLKPTMMCAFSKGKDGCQGDSGGPLIVFEGDGRYVQAGVVSWGIGCADPRYPGVYTKVSNYIDWIKRHTADGSICD